MTASKARIEDIMNTVEDDAKTNTGGSWNEMVHLAMVLSCRSHLSLSLSLFVCLVAPSLLSAVTHTQTLFPALSSLFCNLSASLTHYLFFCPFPSCSVFRFFVLSSVFSFLCQIVTSSANSQETFQIVDTDKKLLLGRKHQVAPSFWCVLSSCGSALLAIRVAVGYYLALLGAVFIYSIPM